MIYIDFKEEDDLCTVIYLTGEISEIHLNRPKRDTILDELIELNLAETLDGDCLSSSLKWKGFHIWWFGQGYIYARLLALRRFEQLLVLIKEHTVIEVNNPPKDFMKIIPIIKRAGIRCKVKFNGKSKRSFLTKFNELIGYNLKLIVSSVGLFSCIIRPDKVLLLASKSVDPELKYDRRAQSIYDEIYKQNLTFIELVTSIQNFDTIRELRLRGRICIYYQQIIHLFIWLIPNKSRPILKRELNDPFQRAALDVFWDYAVINLRKTQIMSILFRLIRPSVLLLIDDPRYMHILTTSAKAQGIPTIAYQHGIPPSKYLGIEWYCFGRDNVGKNHGADKYFVWNDYYRSRLLKLSELYTPDQVVAGGYVKNIQRKSKKRKHRSRRISVLWVGEQHSDLKKVRTYIEAIADDPDIILHYRPRPDNIDIKHKKIVHSWNLGIQFSSTKALDKDIIKYDVVIGTYSSVLYECYLYLVPSVVMAVQSYYDNDLTDEEWAIVAKSPVDLKSMIVKSNKMSTAELLKTQRMIWGESDQSGPERIVQEVIHSASVK